MIYLIAIIVAAAIAYFAFTRAEKKEQDTAEPVEVLSTVINETPKKAVKKTTAKKSDAKKEPKIVVTKAPKKATKPAKKKN